MNEKIAIGIFLLTSAVQGYLVGRKAEAYKRAYQKMCVVCFWMIAFIIAENALLLGYWLK